MQPRDLVMMMFENEPIETFADLLKEDNSALAWGNLLRMCYCEENYENVGGDFGDEDNPPINHKRIAYLERLIKLLEENGIRETE